MPESDLKERSIALLNEILKLLDVECTIEAVDDEEGRVTLKIATEVAGRLIGRGGQTLESLELILNRMLRKQEEEGQRTPWVALDVDGYMVNAPRGEEKHGGERHGRLPFDEMERLKAMAKDIAHEVKKLKTPRVIGPFSPSERRIIHLALENDPEVETISDEQADENRGKKITVRLIERKEGEQC